MAEFTKSGGIYYLTDDDFKQETEMLGKGLRGMFGVKNEKEAVDDIMRNADFTSVEGKDKALDDIRKVSPEAWQVIKEQFNAFEKSDLDIASKRGRPALTKSWNDVKAPAVTNIWASTYLQEYGVSPEELVGLTTDTAITKKIMQLSKDDKIEKGAAGKLISAYKAHMEAERINYMDINEFNPPGSQKSKQVIDINSIKGRGKRVATQAAPDSFNTVGDYDIPPQQYRIERRMGKDVKVPYTPAPEYDVQQRLREQEQETLSNIPGMF